MLSRPRQGSGAGRVHSEHETMKRYALLATTVTLLISIASTANSGDSSRKIRFNRDIRPILSGKCYTCHGPDKNKRKADLRLDLRASATADHDGFAAIVPGDPENSELIARINQAEH